MYLSVYDCKNLDCLPIFCSLQSHLPHAHLQMSLQHSFYLVLWRDMREIQFEAVSNLELFFHIICQLECSFTVLGGCRISAHLLAILFLMFFLVKR